MSTSFRRPFRFLRELPGQYVRGEWTPGAKVEDGFVGTVQPATKADYDRLQVLAEGMRVERAVRVYSDDELYLARKDGSGNLLGADEVLYPPLPFRPGYDGPQYRYKIVGKFPNQSGVISHNKYLAVAVGEQELV